MSQTVQKPVVVSERNRVVPQLRIGNPRTDIPLPTRGAPNPLAPTLDKLDTSASVDVRGAPAEYIRQKVAEYRRHHKLERGTFSVADCGDHVRIWRK